MAIQLARRAMIAADRALAVVLKALVRLYQITLSPFIGRQCRFLPTCSQYALEALEAHGALIGSHLAARRLLRCHPWNAGGFDPVPDHSAVPHKH